MSLARTPSGVAAVASSSLSLEDPALLRGSSVNRVLQCFAWALGPQACTEAHYELSIRVSHIDAFISHNWQTPRSEKFWALALHYNARAAVCCSVLAAGAGFAASTAGILPMLTRDSGQQGVWCQVFGISGFFLGLCFAGDTAVLCRRRATCRTVFLDRTCVCQTDPELKRKGIQSLAAFLARSCSMLVLYSDTYFQKLWTVYELATYLLLFPEGQLIFQPVFFPKVVISGMLLVALSRAAFCIYSLDEVHDWLVLVGVSPMVIDEFLWMLMTVPSIIFLTIMLRLWAVESAKIRERLLSFTISNATCYEEGDRRLIEDNVAIFVKHVGLTEPGASRQEALAAFDMMIHREVPRLFVNRVGRSGIPYHYVVVMYLIYIFYAMDYVAASFQDGTLHPRHMISFVVYCAGVALTAGPLSVALCSSLSRKLRGPWGMLFTGTATFALYNGLMWVYWELTVKAFFESWYLALTVATMCAALLVAYIVYRPLNHVPQFEGKLARGTGKGDSDDHAASDDSDSDVAALSDTDERGSTTEESRRPAAVGCTAPGGEYSGALQLVFCCSPG